MTRDKGEENVICAIRTAKGNHSRSHMNQRKIDVIKEEVLPNLSYETDEIGVIAPYNKQVDAVKSALEEDIDVATVHKFQGREKGCYHYDHCRRCHHFLVRRSKPAQCCYFAG